VRGCRLHAWWQPVQSLLAHAAAQPLLDCVLGCRSTACPRYSLRTLGPARRPHLAPALLEALALVGRQRGQRGLLLLGARGGGRRRRVQRQVHRDGRPRRLPRRARSRRAHAAAGACTRLHHPAATSMPTSLYSLRRLQAAGQTPVSMARDAFPSLIAPCPGASSALTPNAGRSGHRVMKGCRHTPPGKVRADKRRPAAVLNISDRCNSEGTIICTRLPPACHPPGASPWQRRCWRARGPPCAASPRTSAASSCARSSCGSQTGPPQSPQSASPPPAAASAPARASPAAWIEGLR